jgi:hypothetical protein
MQDSQNFPIFRGFSQYDILCCRYCETNFCNTIDYIDTISAMLFVLRMLIMPQIQFQILSKEFHVSDFLNTTTINSKPAKLSKTRQNYNSFAYTMFNGLNFVRSRLRFIFNLKLILNSNYFKMASVGVHFSPGFPLGGGFPTERFAPAWWHETAGGEERLLRRVAQQNEAPLAEF